MRDHCESRAPGGSIWSALQLNGFWTELVDCPQSSFIYTTTAAAAVAAAATAAETPADLPASLSAVSCLPSLLNSHRLFLSFFGTQFFSLSAPTCSRAHKWWANKLGKDHPSQTSSSSSPSDAHTLPSTDFYDAHTRPLFQAGPAV